MSKRMLLGVACLAFAGTALADMACATSGVMSVNTVYSPDRKSVAAIDVDYSPSWSLGADDPAAQVVIKKVVHPGTTVAATSVVRRCEVGASGTFQIASGGLETFRLLHAVEVSGLPKGETLACDIAFGVQSPDSVAWVADSRTNSLQCVADAGEVAPLAYSTDWVTNGTPATVVLTKTCGRYRRGVLQESETTELCRLPAPADGVFDFLPKKEQGGAFTLRCSFLDASGNPLSDELTAFYRFKEQWGMALFLR